MLSLLSYILLMSPLSLEFSSKTPKISLYTFKYIIKLYLNMLITQYVYNSPLLFLFIIFIYLILNNLQSMDN